MADATIVQIGDGIVVELNVSGRFGAGTLGAYRSYQPILDLAALDARDVCVVPLTNPSERADRTKWQRDYNLEIGYRERVEEPTPEYLDPLVALVEQIAEYFRAVKPLSSLPQFWCMGVEINPVFVPEHLDEKNVFTSVIGLTFREWR